MKNFAFILVILSTAWCAAAGLIRHGNLTALDSNSSALPHVEPWIDGTIGWTPSSYWEKLCFVPKIEMLSGSGTNIFKADCASLAGRIYNEPGTLDCDGYASCKSGDCGLQASFDSCSVSVARTNGHPELEFYHPSVGNKDVYGWLNQAREAYKDPIYMHVTQGSEECKGKVSELDSYPKVCWKISKG
ncbi:hypothetical protein PG994_000936 [Apiospora phragmitis]|uniref:Uncharacterized protein n=1 Tax=Apiospora phragmitis TaxID=2905665 RepID=A0ABR1WR53_9PEZI